MKIKKLPKYLINKLKAGEVVERPVSVVKELIENALDANAQNIVLEVLDGGKKLIKVEDDGDGIAESDLEMSIESYATSKIKDEKDLYEISSYGFRGEALASISQVSKFTIQTKSRDSEVGFEFTKIDNDIYSKQIPFHKDSGTIVYVEDLFFNVPARLKFLKSATTETSYITKIFLDFAILNYNKGFKFIKDNKLVYNFKAVHSQVERIFAVSKKDWQKNIKQLEYGDDKMQVYGMISDASLTFNTQDNIKIFINKRPVPDKIIRKAIFQAYERQIPHGEYPLAILFLDVDPGLVDVNVHPRKMEVKFQDPGSVFNMIKQSIVSVFGDSKISGGSYNKFYSEKKTFPNAQQYQKVWENVSKYGVGEKFLGSSSPLDLQMDQQIVGSGYQEQPEIVVGNTYMKVIGQIWDVFIIVEGNDGLYLVDQHALAERIAFENMKKDIEAKGLEPEIILEPISFEVSVSSNLDDKIYQLNKLGFDVSSIGENKIVIYAVPKAFVNYKIDLEKLVDKIWDMEEIKLDLIFDKILANKACKTSIKAGQRLSNLEMGQLIKDGFEYIGGMFVCQHGRPAFVKLDKRDVEGMFERN